jgi:hypothetical protein
LAVKLAIRNLILLAPCLAAGLAATLEAATPSSLGDVWLVTELGVYQGTWTRRIGTNTFDAQWRVDNGQVVRDVIEIESVQNNKVVLYRRGNNGRYHGTLSADGTTVSGTASWYKAGWSWTAKLTGMARDPGIVTAPPVADAAPHRPKPTQAQPPAASAEISSADLARAFTATPEEFDRQYKGRPIRITGMLHQLQLTGNNPIVYVKVGDRTIAGAQAESGTPNALQVLRTYDPAWISGKVLKIEDGLLWLEPGCRVGAEARSPSFDPNGS